MKNLMRQSLKKNLGFTLVELMIGMLIGLFVSLAAVAAFSAHSRTVFNQMTFNQAAEDVSEAYALLSRLIQQSENANITISGVTSAGNCTTDITIDLSVPAGFPVWPNLTPPDYADNWVRIELSSSGVNAHSITLTNASSSGGLAGATATPFAGSNTGNNTKITCLSLVQQAGGTYAFSITGYARNYDAGDTAYEGVIWPRN